MKFKKLFAAILTAALTLTFCLSSAATVADQEITAFYRNIKIYVFDSLIVPKDVNGIVVDPFIYEGTTYLPVRALSEALGLSVKWDDITKTVTVADTEASEVSPKPAEDAPPGQYIDKTISISYRDINIVVNGEKISPTDVNGNATEPFISEGTTYLPVRALAEALGKEVIWEDATKSIYVRSKIYEQGVYQVGTDIPAGEYLITATDSSGYYEVSKDDSGSSESIVVNDMFEGTRYQTVSDGQFLVLRFSKASLVSDLPPRSFPNRLLPPGMYKVGTDFPAGEYVVTCIHDLGAYIRIAQDSTGLVDSIIRSYVFSDDRTISVNNGQYITLNGAELELN